MKKTFYFSTGVKMTTSTYLAKGDIWSPNFVRLIPFECENVPDNASFAFACDNPTLPNHEGFIVAPIVGGNLLSKYAYFKPPVSLASN